MTVREPEENYNRVEQPRLGGWTLVACLAVLGAVAIATLMITRSPEAVTVVVGSLLLALGVSAAR